MFHNIKTNKKAIESAGLFITTKCNLNCKYCYVNKFSKEMDFETAKNAVNLIADSPSSLKEIHFFGGEPLLRYQFIKQVVEYAEKINNFKFKITTNGTLFDEDIFDFLKQKDFEVIVSLDGPQKTNDFSRKHISTVSFFDKIVHSLNTLKDKKIKTSISMTIHPSNAKSLYDDFSYLNEKFDFKINISPAVLIKWPLPSLELYISQFKKCILNNKDKFEDNLNISKRSESIEINEAYCPIRKEISITPRGDILFCSLFMKYNIIPAHFIAGNVHSGFKTKYNKCKYEKYSKKCFDCFSKKYCHNFCHNLGPDNSNFAICNLNQKIFSEINNENIKP